MNVGRIARIVRTLRRRHGWRQSDLGTRAKVSQQAVSLVECGQASRLSIRTLERLLSALEAEIDLVVRWRGGELERLLDEGHARLMGGLVQRLESTDWLVRTEVTYARHGERGSIDLLAFKPDGRVLLVTEIKTDITSVEGTLRKHDEKTRLGALVARERFGWDARSVSRLLVLPAATTPRRQVTSHELVFRASYPLRGADLRAWLRNPIGAVGGILFLSDTNGVGARRELTSRRRICRSNSAGAEGGAGASSGTRTRVPARGAAYHQP